MMPVMHASFSPVIVVGHGSSGTSIFCNSVRKYLRISFGTETQFLLRYYHRLHLYGDLEIDANLRRLVADITSERYFRRSASVVGWHVDRDALFDAVAERTYQGVLSAIFWQLARHNGMDRWGDKALQYEAELPVIRSLFPDAKFIHIVRDGRDVALSVMSRYWGAKNIHTAAHEWRRTVELVDAFCQSLPETQRMVIRYEDFLARPVELFERLIQYLDVDDSSGELKTHIASHIHAELNQANSDKWRTLWSKAQCRAFENIACRELRRFGYDTDVVEAEDASGPVLRAWWAVDNKLRKYARTDYWRDNAYKAALRTGQLFKDIRLRLRRTSPRAAGRNKSCTCSAPDVPSLNRTAPGAHTGESP